MDNQKNQQPQDQSKSKIYDFLTDFNNVLEKHGIDEPILNKELDKLKMSNRIEMSLSHPDLPLRLICNFKWENGRLEVKCTEDN
ncbi:MAG: hypothetical protein C6Y22_25790 [Hapalosiphonaceae cyanobacterium JJU2]|nr:MAG: hypothetical protein C6Y22_25790 [Hapalosiphonaceae cyanobacterium JJU2]